jgi:sporulation protein YlmC with PRC-barrel domain
MTKKLMLGAALSALMLSGAFAQMPKGPTPSSASPAAIKSDQAKTVQSAESKPAAGKADIVMSQKPDQWLASSFKGTDVVGDDGKKIGEVSDILFDKTGKIEAYVVSMGGFLGMGAKEVAIAPSSFTVEPGSHGESDKLKLSMNQNELKQAQSFEPYQPQRPTTTGSAPSSPLGGGMYPPSSDP